MFNHCIILYFTIIIRRNSEHVTGCIGGLKENLPGTENHHFNEFEMTILIVLHISRVSLLQDMLIDVQYTISSL